MRLLRLGPAGQEVPAVEHEGRVLDLRDLTRDITPEFLAADGVRRVADRVLGAHLPTLPKAETMRIGAPISRPQAIIGVGQNYVAHAHESGSAPPSRPIIFFKHPNTVVGPHDDILLPPGAAHLDWEVELAAIIGKQCYRLDHRDAAWAHIAGFTVANDVSERRWQIDESGGQWSKGKSAPTFCPLGPYLRPQAEVDAGALMLETRVNGSPRQKASTADMVFGVDELVHHLSQYLRLEPGDVLLTGTPAGVALGGEADYLAAGDVVELSVTGLGTQRQVVTCGGLR